VGAEWKVTWSEDEDYWNWTHARDFDGFTGDPDDYVALQVMVERWDDERGEFGDREGLGGCLWLYGEQDLFVGETYSLGDSRFESYQAEVVRELAEQVARRAA